MAVALLPHRVRLAGFALLALGIAGAVARFGFHWKPSFLTAKAFALVSVYFRTRYFAVIANDYTNEIIGVLLLAGLVLVALSRERDEDGSLDGIRLRAMVIAALVNAGLVAASFFLVFGFAFVGVLVANLYSFLAIYTVLFQVMRRMRKQERVAAEPPRREEGAGPRS